MKIAFKHSEIGAFNEFLDWCRRHVWIVVEDLSICYQMCIVRLSNAFFKLRILLLVDQWWFKCWSILSSIEHYVRDYEQHWWYLSQYSDNNYQNFSLPWNQTTYCGYIGEITFGTILAVSYGFTMHAVLILFISMCIYHVKFLDMFDHLAEKLDNCSRVQCVNAKLCDMIRFRISVQKWVRLTHFLWIEFQLKNCEIWNDFVVFVRSWFYESAKVYSPFVLVQLISNAAMLSISAYYLDSVQMKFFCLQFLNECA